jgi:hypothetical protein
VYNLLTGEGRGKELNHPTTGAPGPLQIQYSLFQSFVGNQFPAEPTPTTAKREYTPSLILDTTIFELKVKLVLQHSIRFTVPKYAM